MCWRTAMCKLSTGYSHWALESHISSFSTGCWVVSKGIQPSSNLFKVWYSEGLSWHGRETFSITHCSTMVGLVPVWKCPQDPLVKAAIAKYPLKDGISSWEELVPLYFNSHSLFWSLDPVHSELLCTGVKCASRRAEAPGQYVISF